MRLIIYCFLLSIIGCKNSTCKTLAKVSIVPIQQTDLPEVKNYPATKSNIAAYARRNFVINDTFHLKNTFITIVCDSIIPYWPGTKWDFNGFTETPQQGSIACGYFVTTVLRDAGVSINRVALAQCASEKMIQKLVSKKYIHRYSNISQEGFIDGIKKGGKGFYIIGLDNHTGFIHYAEEGIWFIHSSNIKPMGVVKQDAIHNPIISSSKYRVTGKLTDDAAFLKSWYRHIISK